MRDLLPSEQTLNIENVAALAAAAGIAIDQERLQDVATVLSELFALESELAGFALAGLEPDLEPESWPERES